VTTDFDNSTTAASRHAMAVLAAISAMGESLTRAEASLADGYALDLAGLDAEIARLCAAVREAPPNTAQALRRGLEGLLVQVERLQKALRHPGAQEKRP
jgi:hypothetical protein